MSRLCVLVVLACGLCPTVIADKKPTPCWDSPEQRDSRKNVDMCFKDVLNQLMDQPVMHPTTTCQNITIFNNTLVHHVESLRKACNYTEIKINPEIFMDLVSHSFRNISTLKDFNTADNVRCLEAAKEQISTFINKTIGTPISKHSWNHRAVHLHITKRNCNEAAKIKNFTKELLQNVTCDETFVTYVSSLFDFSKERCKIAFDDYKTLPPVDRSRTWIIVICVVAVMVAVPAIIVAIIYIRRIIALKGA